MANPAYFPGPDTEEAAQEVSEAFEPGELTAYPASPEKEPDLTEKEKSALQRLWQEALDRNATARRWEVLQAWEARLFARGYQRLLPLMGGGWIVPPFGAAYVRPTGGNSRKGGSRLETNIYTTYSEIISAALTRDVPHGRFFAYNPDLDADVTAADASNRYAKIFSRINNLMGLLEQTVYYLCHDGRAVIVTDHILDAQRFGRSKPEQQQEVPETEQSTPVSIYLMRHGATARNDQGIARGNDPVPLDEKGRRESDEASSWLADKGILKIVCGPDPRAVETAGIVANKLNVPVEPDERFAPLNIGELAGKPSEQAGEEISQAFGSGESIPGGESEQEIRERVADGLFSRLQETQAGPTLIVTHDSTLREITKLLGSEDPSGHSVLSNGWIGGITQNQDGTLSLEQKYPYLSPDDAADPRQGKPLGEEISTVYGKLESKVPMLAQEQSQMEYVIVFAEQDTAQMKAMIPAKADKIEAGGPKEGQPQLDRIARLSVNLGIEATYIIGDSWQTSTTEAHCWLRPSRFMAVKDEETRMSLLRKFSKGVRMIFAGDTMILARPERMDDHVTVVQAKPGCGQNRDALMSKVLAIQKRLNNWVDLLNHFFVRTVPQRYIDDKAFDLEALREQSNVPGDYIPFNRDAGPDVDPQKLIWVEPPVAHQPALPDFINLFINQIPQLLSGALPTLFGSESNTDVNSATGVVVQRDQALQRLTTTWHRLQHAMCCVYSQSVRLAAQCRTDNLSAPGLAAESIRVELADLRSGSVLCYPEEEGNFPESWIQKQSRYDMMLQLSSTNPILAKTLSAPSNARLARDMAAMKEFKVPEADAYDKQLGEAEVLLRQEPVPNPAREQLLQSADGISAGISFQAAQGLIPDPNAAAQAKQMRAQAQAMPEFVSSLQVVKDWDLHPIEAQAVSDILNSPEGRRRRYSGTPREQAGVHNLELHGMEHKALIQPPPPVEKGASLSANVKDLPPKIASEVMQKKFEVQASPEDFAIMPGGNGNG